MSRRAARPLAAAAVVAGVLAAATPSAAAGENETVTLPRATAAAVVVDLDGDGAREVVRIAVAAVPRPDPALDMVVEAWGVVDSRWALLGAAPLLRPAAGDGARASVDAVTDAFALLTWRDGRGERAMVVAAQDAGPRAGGTIGTCCVDLLDVSLDGDALRLVGLGEVDTDARWVTRLDMDADGTDELLLAGGGSPDLDHTATILTWRDGKFVPERFELGRGERGLALASGDSDGVPGEEAHFGPSEAGRVTRIARVDGALVVESVPWPGWQPYLHGWFAGAGAGAMLLQEADVLSTWRWPRGGSPERMAERRLESPVGWYTIGSGERLTVVEVRGSFGERAKAPSLNVLGPDLEGVVDVEPSDVARELSVLSRREHDAIATRRDGGVYPYIGELPESLHGGAFGYVAMGSLVVTDEAGEVTVEPIGALAGLYPVGAAGPAGAWTVLSHGWVGNGRDAFMAPGRPSFVEGVSLVPTPEALAAEDPDAVRITVTGAAARAASGASRDTVYAAGPGFRAVVSAPSGSQVLALVDGAVVADTRTEDAPVTLAIEPDRDDEPPEGFEAMVAVFAPSGQAYVERWEVVVLRDSPALTVRARTIAGNPAAVVSGKAPAYSSVTVDGSAIAPDDEGTFSHRVGAGLWPRDVEVTVRDPLGNETRERVSVVGLFDYRGLPWIPMVGVITAVCGAWLFLRTPRSLRAGQPAPDDATLEEI